MVKNVTFKERFGLVITSNNDNKLTHYFIQPDEVCEVKEGLVIAVGITTEQHEMLASASTDEVVEYLRISKLISYN